MINKEWLNKRFVLIEFDMFKYGVNWIVGLNSLWWKNNGKKENSLFVFLFYVIYFNN